MGEEGQETRPVPDLDDDAIPVRPYRAGRRRQAVDRPRRRDSYDDDEDMLLQKAKPAVAGTIVCLSIGIVLLIWIGLAPIFSMYANTVLIQGGGGAFAPPLPGSGGMIGLVEGKIIMIVSLVVAMLCVAGLIVYLTAADRAGGVFVTICGCVAGGWGLTALFWNLGFVWDVNTMSPMSLYVPNSLGLGMAPGVGLWLGLGVSIGTVAVFSTMFSLRGQTGWLYLGEGIGFIAGILLITLNVQPWITGETIHPQDPGFLNTKLYKRYWVLWPGFQDGSKKRAVPGFF
jgi:hypothetical protein